MAATTSDFFHLAQRLAQQETDCHWRASVGRAYYAAFHDVLSICDYLPASSDEARIADKISHGEVLRRLDHWNIGAGSSVSYLLALKESACVAVKQMRAARTSRERADYRLDEDVKLDDAKMQIERVRRIRQFVAQVHAECERRNPAA